MTRPVAACLALAYFSKQWLLELRAAVIFQPPIQQRS
jgi:hypothetical protein